MVHKMDLDIRNDDELLSNLRSLIDGNPTTNQLIASMPFLVPIRDDNYTLIGRSSQWRSVRDNFVKKNSSCACCGSKKMLNVHHIRPFHKEPKLELDESNLITLCEGGLGMNCHLWVGHAGRWDCWAEDVVETAAMFLKHLRNRGGASWLG